MEIENTESEETSETGQLEDAKKKPEVIYVSSFPPHLQRLLQMLFWRRPAFSKADDLFCTNFIDAAIPHIVIEEGAKGCRWVRKSDDPILWLAHTDTAHNQEGRQGYLLTQDKSRALAGCTESALGGDDTAGVWLLLELIKAGVGGTFGFMRGEERGGIGSKAMVDCMSKDWFKRFVMAISLDRRGTGSIITRQMGQETCSSEFAEDLARVLDIGMKPDPTGSFTDSYNFRGLIPECTNLSVGFAGEHTQHESLDLVHLTRLRKRLIKRWRDIARIKARRTPTIEREWGFGNIWRFGSGSVGGEKDRLLELVTQWPHRATILLRRQGIGADNFWDLPTRVHTTKKDKK